MNRRMLAAALVAAMLPIAGMAFADGKGKSLFEKKCAVCHELSRALDQTKTRDGWTATVKRMKDVNGCQITDKEADEVVDYLSKVRGKK